MSLTDTLGSLAVATKGQYMTGVSVDIGTSFVKPAGRVGDELIAKATVTGIGRRFPSFGSCVFVHNCFSFHFREIISLY